MDLSTLTDDELRLRLECLIRMERGSTALLLRHLAEVDGRKASDAWGYPSLFAYCTRELHMSEGAAYRRIYASRAASRHPVIYAMLEAGELSLESVVLLRPYLTAENAPRLLEEARHKSKREVELMIRRTDPRADIRDFVMSLPGPDTALAEPEAPSPPPGAPAPPPNSPDRIEPLSAERVHIGFSADCAVWQKLERVKGLLRHKHPRGRLESVIDEIAEHFLDRRDPDRRALRWARRKAKRASPPAPEPSSAGSTTDEHSRYIPQDVKNAVRLRDQGRCAFISRDGRRCPEESELEYDHLIPWALGGRSDDPDNIRLLCRTHNQHAAREVFGPGAVGPR